MSAIQFFSKRVRFSPRPLAGAPPAALEGREEAAATSSMKPAKTPDVDITGSSTSQDAAGGTDSVTPGSGEAREKLLKAAQTAAGKLKEKMESKAAGSSLKKRSASFTVKERVRKRMKKLKGKRMVKPIEDRLQEKPRLKEVAEFKTTPSPVSGDPSWGSSPADITKILQDIGDMTKATRRAGEGGDPAVTEAALQAEMIRYESLLSTPPGDLGLGVAESKGEVDRVAEELAAVAKQEAERLAADRLAAEKAVADAAAERAVREAEEKAAREAEEKAAREAEEKAAREAEEKAAREAEEKAVADRAASEKAAAEKAAQEGAAKEAAAAKAALEVVLPDKSVVPAIVEADRARSSTVSGVGKIKPRTVRSESLFIDTDETLLSKEELVTRKKQVAKLWKDQQKIMDSRGSGFIPAVRREGENFSGSWRLVFSMLLQTRI